MSSPYRIELRELFRLATPLAAAQAGSTLMTLVDIAVLGRLGARELAAAGLGNAFFFGISILGMGIVMGVDPLISQAIGARDEARAHRVLWQGVWLALIVTAVLTIPLMIAPFLLVPIGIDPVLIEPASTYLVVRTLGLLPFLLFFVFRAYLQSRGITRPMLTAMIVCNVFNLFADILFVFGGRVLPTWTGPLQQLPAFGVAGAAVATVLGGLLQLAIVVAAVRKAAPKGVVGVRRWNGAEVRQAFVVGFPIGLTMGAEVGVFALVGILAGRLGTMHLAAHQAVISVVSFTFSVALGIGAAASVRVGVAIGARNHTHTRAAGRAALAAGALVMAGPALLFVFAPETIARLVTDNPAIIAATVPLFLVSAVFQLFDGIQAVGAGALRGAADTRFSFLANLAGHWFVGLPIALYLGFSRQMGITGLWWGLCAGLMAVAVMLFVRFERLTRKPIEPV